MSTWTVSGFAVPPGVHNCPRTVYLFGVILLIATGSEIGLHVDWATASLLISELSSTFLLPGDAVARPMPVNTTAMDAVHIMSRDLGSTFTPVHEN
jgi:hypothetical protein